MSIDYNRLRELRDGATPGPWTVGIDEDWNEVTIANERGRYRIGGDQVRFEMEAGNFEFDPHLVALAPDLARELLRLRDGVEFVRDELQEGAEMLKEDGQRGYAAYVRSHAHTLTDLLEGDTE